MIQIRFEKPEDIAFIRSVNEQAFDSLAEAKLVDKLRLTCSEYLSLVADDNGSIVGHIMFTPVLVTGVKQKAQGMGLVGSDGCPSFTTTPGNRNHAGKVQLADSQGKEVPFCHCPWSS